MHTKIKYLEKQYKYLEQENLNLKKELDSQRLQQMNWTENWKTMAILLGEKIDMDNNISSTLEKDTQTVIG